APFDVAILLQLAEESLHRRQRQGPQYADAHVFLRLLPTRRQRPYCRAAEQRDERAPPHSITSSARSRMEVGTVTPRVLAVLRFTTSWNWAGRSIGRSAGLRPCSTLPIITPL